MSRRQTLATAFSTPAEVHAFANGLYAGRWLGDGGVPTTQDSLRELHYWRAGVVAADFVQALVVAAAAVVAIRALRS